GRSVHIGAPAELAPSDSPRLSENAALKQLRACPPIWTDRPACPMRRHSTCPPRPLRSLKMAITIFRDRCAFRYPGELFTTGNWHKQYAFALGDERELLACSPSLSITY